MDPSERLLFNLASSGFVFMDLSTQPDGYLASSARGVEGGLGQCLPYYPPCVRMYAVSVYIGSIETKRVHWLFKKAKVF